MFFDGWQDVWQVVVTALLAYVALVFLLRISGKRTLSKMNMFDFVVTIAFGSILASTILSADVSLAEGAAAFAVLIGAQYAVTWLSVRSRRFQSIIKADPTLLYHKGRFLREAMRRERVAKEEILAAFRESSYSEPDEAHSVIIETDGTLTVVKGPVKADRGSLRTVEGGEDIGVG